MPARMQLTVILSGEMTILHRKRLFITTADGDAVTKEDALKIDILQGSLERQKNDMYEKLIIDMINEGSEE